MVSRAWFRRTISIPLASVVLAAIGGSTPAQNPDTQTRQLWDTEFVDKRPKAAKPTAKPKPRVYKQAAPAMITSTGREPEKVETALVGVTLWRLREPKKTEGEDTRMLVHRPASTGTVSLTPERIASGTPLVINSFVRLAIESPRKGYLYVIDREVYADGKRSEPDLIFPTMATRGGDNSVEAGKIIEIPAQTDVPEYFTVVRTRDDQVAELITIIVSPEPIPGLAIGDEPLKLKPEQVDEWSRKWSVGVERLELEGGAGTTYTASEKKAGADPTTLLSQDDALPQTLYKVTTPVGTPVLVNVELRIK